jgi:hypothetical protein
LRQSELENAPKDKAISYVCGDPAKEISVLYDGKIIMVTKTFKDALLQL